MLWVLWYSEFMVTDIYPSLKHLGRPEAIKKSLLRKSSGLTLISGKPCSGVTTTITALANEIQNHNLSVVHLRFGDDEELPNVDSISVEDDDDSILSHMTGEGQAHLVIIDNLASPKIAALAYQIAEFGGWVVAGMHANSENDAVEKFLVTASHAMPYDPAMNSLIKTSVYQSFVAPAQDKESVRDRGMIDYCLMHVREMMYEINPDRNYTAKHYVDISYKILTFDPFL